MAGFGLQPAGTSNAGWGSPPTAQEQTGRMLADAQGQSTGARKIDPVTKDYELNEHGRIAGMAPVAQIVQLSVRTEKFSSAVAEMGQLLRSVDRVTANIEARCLAQLTDALRPAVDAKLVEVLGFSTFKASKRDGLREGVTYGRLRWRDLTTGREAEEIV